MKKIIFIICICAYTITNAQTPSSNVIEGGKAIVELIRIFKSKKQNPDNAKTPDLNTQTLSPNDSCGINQRSDLCYVNNSSRSFVISIFKRNGDSYAPQPYTIKVLSQKQECWYELKAGIYKYRIEADSGHSKILISEGEFKLEACDNMVREITE